MKYMRCTVCKLVAYRFRLSQGEKMLPIKIFMQNSKVKKQHFKIQHFAFQIQYCFTSLLQYALLLKLLLSYVHCTLYILGISSTSHRKPIAFACSAL